MKYLISILVVLLASGCSLKGDILFKEGKDTYTVKYTIVDSQQELEKEYNRMYKVLRTTNKENTIKMSVDAFTYMSKDDPICNIFMIKFVNYLFHDLVRILGHENLHCIAGDFHETGIKTKYPKRMGIYIK